MSDQPSKQQFKFPENAYRELKPGETFVPMVPPNVTVPELTARSIVFGLVMNILFAMAATYLALKVGQGIETAIPISILAVGLSGFLLKMGLRRSTIIENINILAISTTSGMVAGGTVFTMPAIYLLKLNDHLNLSNGMIFLHIALVPFLGAILGVIFLVPFRRYFVKDMHGKLPFPEGTATNEILVTGQTGGNNAFILVYSFILASLYTIGTALLKLWPEEFTTGEIHVAWKEKAQAAGAAMKDAAASAVETVEQSVTTLAFEGGLFETLTVKVKAIFSMGTGAEFLGLGFIIGVRYASIIMAGSFLSFFVIVPLLGPLSLEALQAINPAIQNAEPSTIFNNIPKNIGIGCIFTAGLLSILKMSKVIVTALREALGSLFRKGGTVVAHDRTDEDISYPVLGALGIATTIAIAAYFRFFVLNTMDNPNFLTLMSVLLALVVAFIFITVSAWAIATISVTPISGMTVTTIIITAVVLVLVCDLPKGPAGQLAVLLVGGVVASSLSVAGTLVTEFKLGYWAGASPKRIQWSCILACALAAVVVTGTIMVLAGTMGFDPQVDPKALQAPQANLMKSALDSFLGTGQVPWLPYGVGVVLALLLELVGISPLAFGLGMYLPMWLNAPILVGALVSAGLKKGKADDATKKARNDKGIIIASGFIAGAAIMGVVLNGLPSIPGGIGEGIQRFFDRLDIQGAMIRSGSDPVDIGRLFNWFGLIAFLALCAFIFWDSRRAKPELGEGDIG
jgi:OPT family oligopeptide transporter